MTTEQLLFGLAVFGNLILVYYAIKIGFQAAMRFRKGDRVGALWNASAASALVGLTVLFPWTLISGEREIGKVALLICILTPFVVSMTKLWPSVKGRIARAPMLVADAAIVGMVVAFAVSGNWVWFWIAGMAMAVIWIVARKSVPRKPQMAVSQGVQLDPANEPFEEFYGPERDIANPYHIGHR
jgi:hypothetical protein